MSSVIPLTSIAEPLGYTSQFVRQEAERLGIPVEAIREGQQGRPALGIPEEKAPRLVLALRLRKEHRLRGRTLYAILDLVPDPSHVKRGRRGKVLLDGVGFYRDWREALRGQLTLKLEFGEAKRGT